jgi:NAD(P)H-dependent FMN reductase
MCMSEISRLLILIGSVRDGRFGPVVASWVADRAREHGTFEVDVMDLAEVEIPLALPAESPKMAAGAYPRPAGMAGLTARLDAADAFVLVTPEYNHSYPASLKAAIDWHFTQWKAKPVAFVSYGGAAGGRHAVLHLENVLTELHAVTIREGLAFPSYWKILNAACHSTRKHRNTPRPCSSSSPGGPAHCVRPAPNPLPWVNCNGKNHRIRPRRHRHRRPRPHRHLLPARL